MRADLKRLVAWNTLVVLAILLAIGLCLLSGMPPR